MTQQQKQITNMASGEILVDLKLSYKKGKFKASHRMRPKAKSYAIWTLQQDEDQAIGTNGGTSWLLRPNQS